MLRPRCWIAPLISALSVEHLALAPDNVFVILSISEGSPYLRDASRICELPRIHWG